MNVQKELSLKDVQELADSCRIALSHEELIKYQGDLNDLLELVSVLEMVPSKEMPPAGITVISDLREDRSAEESEPSSSFGQSYWVPSVLER